MKQEQPHWDDYLLPTLSDSLIKYAVWDVLALMEINDKLDGGPTLVSSCVLV